MAQTLPRAAPARDWPINPGATAPEFSPDVVVAVKALTCELPSTAGVPLVRSTHRTWPVPPIVDNGPPTAADPPSTGCSPAGPPCG